MKYLFIVLSLYFFSFSLLASDVPIPDQEEILCFTIDYANISVVDVQINHQVKLQHKINVIAKSKKVISLFTHSLNNFYCLSMDSLYYPLELQKNILQSNFQENSVTQYNHDTLKAVYENTIDGSKKTYSIQKDTRDFFSLLFFLRNSEITLLNNQSFFIDAAGKTWIVSLKTLKKEFLKTKIGRFNTIKVEITFKQFDQQPKIRSDILTNNLVHEKNTLYLWISLDENKIPVQACFLRKPFNIFWIINSYNKK